ncbi:hypothetical protein PTTG_12221 [Puccinia triticina 1-1 BBBD Race 1]|uniref:Uncharacterized protein n=2 Tax=Puccinia triticina TaxID=208348 RepID=A0A180GSJ6_PUCT1|nr:uncharacterized protein PtA15_14A165 [Puccinia triticina]OAV95705.1 hypothetical protein PTTG_12221 [Puccinia triticina 1-1 BBBD Race 1]WAQ91283.1 hypothetical protein PtA15_14A165 [Puccinia triticina]WAR62087.1 hypothetical protein PtB15_14B181 [Puccinia triticina]
MAFLRGLMSVLMVSIWVGMALGAATNGGATTGLDATKKAGGADTGSLAASLAAYPGELSGKCNDAIISMGADVDDCAALTPMVMIRMAQTKFSEPIKTWLKALCKATPCTKAALTAANDKFKAGCGAELKSNSMDAKALLSLLNGHEALKADACPNIEKLNFCESSLEGHFKQTSAADRPFFSVPKAAYCIECVKNNPISDKKKMCDGKNGSDFKPVAGLVKPIVVALPGTTKSTKAPPAGGKPAGPPAKSTPPPK